MIKSVVPGNPVSDVSRFIENLVGSSHSDIMCNTSITASDNVMDGELGNDVMTGGNGDDNYVVNAAGDVVTEVAGQGTDRVQSAVAYTLATRPDIENLTLTGVTNSNGTGNGTSNILIGNDGCQHSEGECWRRFSDRWGGCRSVCIRSSG